MAAVAPDLHIYIGSWTNWSRGSTFGATLTMTRDNGNLLIAFIALFVTFVGTCSFRIACFTFHRIFSKSSPQDAIYHQRQAILRNSSNGVTAIWEMCLLFWSWRRKKQRTILRILPMTIYIALNVATFTTIGIFSSNIAGTTGNEVLINESPFCGSSYPKENISFGDTTTKLLPIYTQQFQSFFNYAQDCYAARLSDGRCGSFIKGQLNSVVNRNASCPFRSEMCRSQYGNIEIDTGLIDTNFDLGVNAPKDKGVLLRRVINCSPLVTEGYSINANMSGRIFTSYYYGPDFLNGGSEVNYTYRHAQAEGPGFGILSTASEYDLAARAAYNHKGQIDTSSTFLPIKALNRTDADVYLFFLSSNGIVYPNPVDGYWYAAHRPAGVPLTTASDPQHRNDLYLADEAASPLGCAVQFQTCLGDRSLNPRCSSLGTHLDINQVEISPPDITSSESMRIRRVWDMTGRFLDLGAFTRSLGTASLMAKYSLYQGFQGPIPDNQWQLDVERWHNATLASMQGALVIGAAGLTETLRPFNEIMKDESTTDICKNQKVRSTAYANFSIFGLSLIFVIGGIIIITNYLLESFFLDSVFHCFKNRHLEARYQKLEWYMNGTLQLQRLAHEQLGYGDWAKCDSEMPVTESKGPLAVLDLHDPKHPRFATITPLSSTLSSGGINNSSLVEESAEQGTYQHILTSNIGVPGSPIISSRRFGETPPADNGDDHGFNRL